MNNLNIFNVDNESEFGSGECGDKCGDGHAEGTSPAAIPFPLLHPSPLGL